MNNGIIAINKPKDWTSFDVVNKLKHMLKPSKVGHLGTLDPMATGVLLVTIGKATKLFDLMQEKRKRYLATFEFGFTTDTLDSTGSIVSNTDNIPTKDMIDNVLAKFLGEIDQLPPKFSAKSINGKRAYVLAREHTEFELSTKKVKIYDIKLISYTDKLLTLDIECGSGTYIRSLGRDIAIDLNSEATMTSLVRTNIDKFSLNDCHNIEDLDKDNIEDKIIKINDILDYPTLNIDDASAKKILNGMTIILDKIDGYYKLNTEIDTIAIVKIENNKAKMSLFFGI